MKTTKTHIIPDVACPTCSYEFIRATGFDGKKPQPHDVTMCMGCSEIFIFNEDMSIRLPNDDDLRDLPLDEISKMQYFLNQMRKQRERNERT